MRYTAEDCDNVATIVSDAMNAAIDDKDVIAITRFALSQCSGEVITVCASFFSNQEAAKLQPDADAVLNTLFDVAVDECGAGSYGYTQMAEVGGANGGFDCLMGTREYYCPYPPPPPSPPPPPPPSPPPPSPPPPSPPPPPPPSPPPPSPPPPSPPPPPPPSPPPPSPPPPSPPPPSPPPPSPPPPCEACVYLSIVETGTVVFPYEFSQSDCDDYSAMIADEIQTEADNLGVAINFSPVVCAADEIKLCATFFSSEEGAKLQPFIDERLQFWLELVTGPQGCPAYLTGYSAYASVGGSGGTATEPSASCLSGIETTACAPDKVDFPKCACVTTPGATPFAFKPTMFSQAGRTKDTTSYCFNTTIVTPNSLTSPCGRSANLLKAEFYADDNLRRKISGVYIQPSGGPGKWLSATWGAVGEQTVKATPVNWSKGQADGGIICLELNNDTAIEDFCLPSTSGTCWGNLFDDSKNCCPLYQADLVN